MNPECHRQDGTGICRFQKSISQGTLVVSGMFSPFLAGVLLAQIDAQG
jgi:hypothetical protein